MRAISRRIYSDYLAPSRLPEFGSLIRAATARGYQHRTLADFHEESRWTGAPRHRVFLHRHDIDTDAKTAGRMFEIEAAHGIRSTYYFRLSTLDPVLMRAISASGSEVGYHYEEVAQYCKSRGVATARAIESGMPVIRRAFKANFARLEDMLGQKIRSVSSHGDFVNRRLGITNRVLLDQELRDELGIEFEDYDPEVRARYSVTLSDREPPAGYRDMSPFEAIEHDYPVIHLLTHPRHWHTNPWANTGDNLRRMYEGVRWSLTRFLAERRG